MWANPRNSPPSCVCDRLQTISRTELADIQNSIHVRMQCCDEIMMVWLTLRYCVWMLQRLSQRSRDLADNAFAVESSLAPQVIGCMRFNAVML